MVIGPEAASTTQAPFRATSGAWTDDKMAIASTLLGGNHASCAARGPAPPPSRPHRPADPADHQGSVKYRHRAAAWPAARGTGFAD